MFEVAVHQILTNLTDSLTLVDIVAAVGAGVKSKANAKLEITSVLFSTPRLVPTNVIMLSLGVPSRLLQQCIQR